MATSVWNINAGKYHVSVTADDIQHGVKDDAGCCAVALALRRVFPVDPREIEIEYRRFYLGSLEARVPEAAETFIRSFDAGVPVEPMEFDLDMDWKEPQE